MLRISSTLSTRGEGKMAASRLRYLVHNPIPVRSTSEPPMSFQIYLAFVAACIALALLPGPMVTLVIANGLRHGTRGALINIAGAQLGLAIVIGVVAIGLTSLMATMGYWFDWVRFAGAAS